MTPQTQDAAARNPVAQGQKRMFKGMLALVAVVVVLPVLLIVTMRFVPPPITAFMLQSDTDPVYYHWVPKEQIAEVARKAVVAAEDQKFWSHDGFDFDAMSEAHEKNKKRKKKRGASTISQQTAKNLFLWSGGGYFRKGIEAGLTVLIEAIWPKTRILEVYLNVAEFGPGIYGVEAAAQKIFGKPAANLNAAEAARLAAVLPNPTRWSAANPGSYVGRRSDWVMGQMGYRRPGPTIPIEEPEDPDAQEEPVAADVPPPESPMPNEFEVLPAAAQPEVFESEVVTDTPEPERESGSSPNRVFNESGGGEVRDEPVEPAEVTEEAPG